MVFIVFRLFKFIFLIELHCTFLIYYKLWPYYAYFFNRCILQLSGELVNYRWRFVS